MKIQYLFDVNENGN